MACTTADAALVAASMMSLWASRVWLWRAFFGHLELGELLGLVVEEFT